MLSRPVARIVLWVLALALVAITAWAWAGQSREGARQRESTTREELFPAGAGPVRAAFVPDDEHGAPIRVYGSEIVFAAGRRVPVDPAAEVRSFDDGIVAIEAGEGTLAYTTYDMQGQVLARKTFEHPGTVRVAADGSVLVSDGTEGYGTRLFVFAADGRPVATLQPYERGFSLDLSASHGGRFLVYVKPDHADDGSPRVYLIEATDGEIRLLQDVDLQSPSSVELSDDMFVIHDTDSVDGRFVSRLAVFGVDGGKIRTVESYAFCYELDDANRKLVVCDRESVKRIDLARGTADWERRYAELYEPDRIVKPDDIPAGFDLYPFDLGHLAGGSTVALLMAQSSFNPVAPRYQGELILMKGADGSVVDRLDLGTRNQMLRLQSRGDRVHVIRDTGVLTHELD